MLFLHAAFREGGTVQTQAQGLDCSHAVKKMLIDVLGALQSIQSENVRAGWTVDIHTNIYTHDMSRFHINTQTPSDKITVLRGYSLRL